MEKELSTMERLKKHMDENSEDWYNKNVLQDNKTDDEGEK